jgi:hypothetical protein
MKNINLICRLFSQTVVLWSTINSSIKNTYLAKLSDNTSFVEYLNTFELEELETLVKGHDEGLLPSLPDDIFGLLLDTIENKKSYNKMFYKNSDESDIITR